MDPLCGRQPEFLNVTLAAKAQQLVKRLIDGQLEMSARTRECIYLLKHSEPDKHLIRGI
jgi:hypothetical protein